MKRMFACLIGIFLFSLTSCSNSFNVVRKVKVIDDSKLYLGCYDQVKSEDGINLDVFLYLDFYLKNEIVEDDLNYDQVVNISNDELVVLDESLIDGDGNVLKFYDSNTILGDYIGSYETIGDYFSDGNHLAVFFSYGELFDDFCITTSRVNIDKPGIYYFGTVSKDGQYPSYNHSKIFTEEVQWFNPFE